MSGLLGLGLLFLAIAMCLIGRMAANLDKRVKDLEGDAIEAGFFHTSEDDR